MLTVESLTVGYGRRVIAQDISFQVGAGQVVAILGPNGAGKSTLVKTLLGSLAALGGRICWQRDRDVPVAYLSQMTEFDRQFPMDVRALVASGAWGQRRRGLAAPEKVQAALVQVELEHLAHKPVHELSGGQLQRARFARTLIQDAQFLILDEPFSAVDQQRAAALVRLIERGAEVGRTFILVVHDLTAALQLCSHAVLMGKSGADFGPIADVLSPERVVARDYVHDTQAHLLHKAIRDYLDR